MSSQLISAHLSMSPLVSAHRFPQDGNLVVIISDTIYNICDGVLIATAFNSCDSSLGWTLLGTILLYQALPIPPMSQPRNLQLTRRPVRFHTR